MRWFKHYTDCYKSESLAWLISEYGISGYGRWWIILETVANRMDESGNFHAEYPAEIWATFLKQKQNKMILFLKQIENKMKIKLEQNGNILKISVPNLLKIKDEYSRKSGQTPDKLLTKIQNKKQNTDTETDKDKKNLSTGKKTSTVFSAPSQETMISFFVEIGGDAGMGEDCWLFYESKGWKVGNAPMKSWQMTARRWLREEIKRGYSKQEIISVSHRPAAVVAEELAATDIKANRAMYMKLENELRASCSKEGKSIVEFLG